MAYNRYENSQTLKNSNGKEYFSTNLISGIDYDINDIYIISKKGDRLDLYAAKYYGDTTKWPYIARANYIGKGSLMVEPNQQIRIPMKLDDIRTNDNLLNI